MTVFGGAGGRNNEGRMQVDGLNVGAGLGGSGVSTYVADISNAQEVVHHHLGRPWRSGGGRPHAQHRSEERRQHHRRQRLPVGRRRRHDRQQLQRRAAGGRADHAGEAAQAVGFHLRDRRPDRQGPAVVSRRGARRGAAPVDSQRLPQPERRGSDEVPLRARSRSREVRGAESWRLYTVRLTYQATSKDKFNVHWDEQHPCNGSTFSPDEDGCRNQPESGSVYGPLGLGGLSSTTSPEIGGYLNAHPRVRQVTWMQTATNRMLARSRLRRVSGAVRSLREPGQHHAAARARHRAVRRGMLGQRRHPQPHLPLGELVRQLGRAVHLARLGVVRDRRAQPEGGLRRRGAGVGPAELQQRPEPGVHVQQRRADAAHAEPAALHDQPPHAEHVALRPGPVDAGPHDAAGRAALRPQLELLARAAHRPRRTSCRPRSCSPKRRA